MIHLPPGELTALAVSAGAALFAAALTAFVQGVRLAWTAFRRRQERAVRWDS